MEPSGKGSLLYYGNYNNLPSFYHMSPSTSSALVEVLTTLLPFALGFGLCKLICRHVKQLARHPRLKGWMGEQSVVLSLRRLNPEIYRVFHDLYLPRPDGKGSTQVDHVVVSEYGIFVIETKNLGGCIFGSESDTSWTQVFTQQKHTFQNPLHQNALHIHALQKYLGLGRDKFHSVIFFRGKCSFRTPRPESVILRGLLNHLLSHREIHLHPAEARRAQDALTVLVESTNRSVASREHRLGLEQLHPKTL